MKSLIKAYIPFIVYSLCVIFAYFITFYLLPKYNEPLAYPGFLLIYLYIYCGSFFFGFFIGKITLRRLGFFNFGICLFLSVISYVIMIFVGSLKEIFTYMYCDFPITFPLFFDSVSDIDTLILSIGTLITFFIGEITEQNKSSRVTM